MLSRMRLPSGLLGLLAATLFMAEGLLAAHCAPPAASGARAAAHAVEAGAGFRGDVPESGPMDCCDSDRGGFGPGEDGAPCPFSPVASPGSCLSVGMPSPETPTLSAAVPSQALLPEAQRGADLLHAASLFRPPRA